MNISLCTFQKTEFKYLKSLKTGSFFKKRKLLKLNEFPDIYDVQIITMVCINYRFVNVVRERRASANKNDLVYIYYNKDIRIG